MRVASPALALCTLLAASPLLAQSNAERMANDAYTRSHDYDLIHQTIRLADVNWDSTSFTGSVTTTLVALRPGLDSVILDAGHLLHITSVTAARGGTLRFATPGDTLVVFPAKPVAFHDTLTFTVTYAGKVENGRGLTFITPEGRSHRPQPRSGSGRRRGPPQAAKTGRQPGRIRRCFSLPLFRPPRTRSGFSPLYPCG